MSESEKAAKSRAIWLTNGTLSVGGGTSKQRNGARLTRSNNFAGPSRRTSDERVETGHYRLSFHMHGTVYSTVE